ncbi:hypothetical protein Bca52824_074975 [Brassica carinata]|uniref:Uncharacterized protein n=1 Tax=Brassica carinata TaxID=52824 RepID=A0A8X7TXH8_BRACI|nr:hypothetical protein Bca52824_074975 [Brassica carinata]
MNTLFFESLFPEDLYQNPTKATDEQPQTTPAPSSSSPSSLDLNQWCSYHKFKAHDTRDCRTSNVELPKLRPNNAKRWSKNKEKKAQKPQDKADTQPKRAEDDKPDEQDEDETCADTEQPRNRRRVQVILTRPSSSSDEEEDATVCDSQEHPAGLKSESSDPSGACDLRNKFKRKLQAGQSTHGSGSDLHTVINKSRAKQPENDHQITFSPDDAAGIHLLHNDPLLVELGIAKYEVAKVLIDTGSSVDLIFLDTLNKMGVGLRDMKPCVT